MLVCVIVSLSVLASLSSASVVGPAHLLNDDKTWLFALAPLDTDVVAACYFDTGLQDFATCKAVSALGLDLSSGPPLSLSSGTRVALAVARVGLAKAVVCVGYEFAAASCAVLMQSVSTLTQEIFLNVSTSTAGYLALTQINTDKVIVCYVDQVDSDYAKCSVLLVSGAGLTSGSTLTINGDATAYVALTALSPDRAVACFQVQPLPAHGHCAVLSATGSALAQGPQFLAAADASNDITHIALAQLDSDKAVICYKAFAATCNVLAASGDSLTKGPDLVVDPVATQIQLASLGTDAAAVCYRRVNALTGECNMLTASGLQLTKTLVALQFSASDVSDLSVAQLDAAKVAVCYQEVSNSHKGKCNAVDFTVTSTSTTSTTTTSTGTSSTTTSSATTTTVTTSTTSTTTSTTTLRVPEVSVTGVGFLDEDLGLAMLGGPVAWQPPSDMSKVTLYAVYLAPSVTDNENTRVKVGPDLPAGTNTMYVPLGTPLGSHLYVLVYTANAHGRQDTIPGSVSITDAARPTVNVSALSFFDVDIDGGEVAGTLSWTPPSDFSLVTQYNVYLASDASATDKDLLQSVAIGTNFIIVASETTLGNMTHFFVITANSYAEAPAGVALQINDRAVPDSGVSAASFLDVNTQAGRIEGNVSWLQPSDVSNTDYYTIYIAHDNAGSMRLLLGNVSLSTARLALQSMSLGSFGYLLIYAANSVGEQRSPTIVLISDVGLDFVDTDLHVGTIGGAVSWVQGAVVPVRVRVFVAEGYSATDVRSEVATSMTKVIIDRLPKLTLLMAHLDSGLMLTSDVAIQGNNGSVALFTGMRVLSAESMLGQPQTQSALGLLPLPLELVLGYDPDPQATSFLMAHGVPLANYQYLQVLSEDAQGAMNLRVGGILDRAVPTVGVSQLSFVDYDLTGREIGGRIRWTPPASASAQVTRYAVYLALEPDAGGSDRTLLAELPVLANEVAVAHGTPAWPWAQVLAGNAIGFNETTMGTLRLLDLGVYGRMRTWMEAELCKEG